MASTAKMKGTHKRGCELIQGHYSPVSLPVGRLELLALGYILLDFINRYLCFHLAAASASALPVLPGSSNASIAARSP